MLAASTKRHIRLFVKSAIPILGCYAITQYGISFSNRQVEGERRHDERTLTSDVPIQHHQLQEMFRTAGIGATEHNTESVRPKKLHNMHGLHMPHHLTKADKARDENSTANAVAAPPPRAKRLHHPHNLASHAKAFDKANPIHIVKAAVVESALVPTLDVGTSNRLKKLHSSYDLHDMKIHKPHHLTKSPSKPVAAPALDSVPTTDVLRPKKLHHSKGDVQDLKVRMLPQDNHAAMFFILFCFFCFFQGCQAAPRPGP
jgi:hypothetical protein